MELMEQIATNAAHYAVDNWGKHLGKGQRVAMWNRYYDSALAALMTYEETNHARIVRVRSIVSEN